MKKQQQKEQSIKDIMLSADYLNKRTAIMHELNPKYESISGENWKKDNKEKAELLTVKRNWKENDKEFYKEFMTNQLPNWGAMKFQGIQL